VDGLDSSATSLTIERMSRFGSQYQVARPTGVCAATGQTLEPGSTCIATLCEPPEGGGLERRDFSLAAWASDARPEGLFSFWRTTVAEPGERRRLLVDDDVLMDLFERLAGDDRPQRTAFRFVLALILMRKRLLRFVGRKTASGSGGDDDAGRRAAEHWLLRPRGALPEDPPIEVANPRLGDEDVRELTAQLSEILRGSFD